MKKGMGIWLKVVLVVITLFFIVMLYQSISDRLTAGIAGIKAPVGIVLEKMRRRKT